MRRFHSDYCYSTGILFFFKWTFLVPVYLSFHFIFHVLGKAWIFHTFVLKERLTGRQLGSFFHLVCIESRFHFSVLPSGCDTPSPPHPSPLTLFFAFMPLCTSTGIEIVLPWEFQGWIWSCDFQFPALRHVPSAQTQTAARFFFQSCKSGCRCRQNPSAWLCSCNVHMVSSQGGESTRPPMGHYWGKAALTKLTLTLIIWCIQGLGNNVRDPETQLLLQGRRRDRAYELFTHRERDKGTHTNTHRPLIRFGLRYWQSGNCVCELESSYTGGSRWKMSIDWMNKQTITPDK